VRLVFRFTGMHDEAGIFKRSSFERFLPPSMPTTEGARLYMYLVPCVRTSNQFPPLE
jgi:hypothetical protein